jgi:hypothetical protein
MIFLQSQTGIEKRWRASKQVMFPESIRITGHP